MKTLIAYATKHGSTEKCAQILAEKLTDQVELCNLKKNQTLDLTQYDQVIIGGSIYAGNIRKEVKVFCAENLDQLQKKRLGLFICNMQPEDAEQILQMAFPEELLARAVAKESFGGEFNFKSMNFMERFIIKTVTKKQQGTPVDTKQDISNLSQERLDRFVQLMNTA